MSKNYKDNNYEKYSDSYEIKEKDIFEEEWHHESEDDACAPEKENCFGEVFNCDKLNIREEANIESAIKKVINRGAVVEIIEEESTDEWYKIFSENGDDGFCMRSFIKKK